MADPRHQPHRAVVDIGSNTVRLVVYAGPERAPRTWLNESVNARLGRDLSTTGLMPDKAIKQALAALARYATILRDLGITDVLTVATAAARDARNGGEFLGQVAKLGLEPQLLTGTEEAYGSAFGVIGAFPRACGVVADLGGGSLELVEVGHGKCHHGVSLALGTLRLPAMRQRGAAHLTEATRQEIQKTGWVPREASNLFLVGGTWRAIAAYAIDAGSYPLTDPHAFSIEIAQARRIAKDLAAMSPAALEEIPGISASRAASLPDAAALMSGLLAELLPRTLVFSSWGLREGLLFQRLPDAVRVQDPLLVAIADFSEPRDGSAALAHEIVRWASRAAQDEKQGANRLRLKLASAQLALAAAHIEPNLRARQSFEWAMDKRWVGLAPADRAWIAAALLASVGKVAPPPELERLTDWETLSSAIAWGLTVRLARRLAAGCDATLRGGKLERSEGRLLLILESSRAQQCSPKVTNDLKNLAKWSGLDPVVEIAKDLTK